MTERLKTQLFTRKVGNAEQISLAIYMGLLALILYFHEPWFDEAQAWQIARTAPLHDILFVVPHYEGHPPVWHLLLAVFAKNGFPYELTLKAINWLFCSAAMAVLLFRSPFPKVIRCLLPFTFECFYQIGVISRPYSIFMLMMFLAAIGYRERNTHPWRYILPLMAVCLATAYGMLLAGGLCLAWTIEIAAELIREKRCGTFWKDRRFWALCAILALALLMIPILIPAEDVYFTGIEVSRMPLWEQIRERYDRLFLVTFDTFVGACLTPAALQKTDANLYFGLVGGTVCWAVLLLVAKANRRMLQFLAPYGAYMLFVLFGYFSYHHVGIGTIFLLFWAWTLLDAEGGFVVPPLFVKIWNELDSALVRRFVKGAGAVLCVIPVVYAAVSAVNDIRTDYGPRAAADFIKEHHMEDCKIMMAWDFTEERIPLKEGGLSNTMHIPSAHGKILEQYPDLQGHGSTLSAYFDRNIFMNFNVDHPGDLYMHYSYADNEALFQKWTAQGLPDVLIDYCLIDEIYPPEMLEGMDYVVVADLTYGLIYKLTMTGDHLYIYLRSDLLDEYPDLEQIYP